MGLIYIANWAREEVKTEAAYYTWLNSLTDNDLVIQQEFVPIDKGLLGLGTEHWRFTLSTIRGNRIYQPKAHPINRKKGYSCWWSNDTEWGEVFPARLIPNHYRFNLTELGQSVIGHKPVYEPLFLNQHRFVYLIELGQNYRQRQQLVKNTYPRSYYTECEEGFLYHCFSKNKKDVEREDIKFLYSDYLEQ